MYLLPNDRVSVARSGNNQWPTAIRCLCPFCQDWTRYVFTTDQWKGAVGAAGIQTLCGCPVCGERAAFFHLAPITIGTSERETYMRPSPRRDRRPVEGIAQVAESEPRLESTYLHALNSYNLGQWEAAAILARKVLEGIARGYVPEAGRMPLGPLLGKLSDVDLSAPIRDLAQAVKSAGDAGAHFDAEVEVTEPIASEMIDLLDFIVTYLVIAPAKAAALSKTLNPGTPDS